MVEFSSTGHLLKKERCYEQDLVRDTYPYDKLDCIMFVLQLYWHCLVWFKMWLRQLSFLFLTLNRNLVPQLFSAVSWHMALLHRKSFYHLPLPWPVGSGSLSLSATFFFGSMIGNGGRFRIEYMLCEMGLFFASCKKITPPACHSIPSQITCLSLSTLVGIPRGFPFFSHELMLLLHVPSLLTFFQVIKCGSYW